MSFKDMVKADNLNVFMNTLEFADYRTIIYDGVTYDGADDYEGKGVPIVMTGLKEKDRTTIQSDHAQGLYRVTSVLHMRIDDLGGNQPEKGALIKINDEEGGGGFFREFYVAFSGCEMGMLRVELEAIDE